MPCRGYISETLAGILDRQKVSDCMVDFGITKKKVLRDSILLIEETILNFVFLEHEM